MLQSNSSLDEPNRDHSPSPLKSLKLENSPLNHINCRNHTKITTEEKRDKCLINIWGRGRVLYT